MCLACLLLCRPQTTFAIEGEFMKNKKFKWFIFLPVVLQACGVMGGGSRNAKEYALQEQPLVKKLKTNSSVGKTVLEIYSGTMDVTGLTQVGIASYVITKSYP